MNALLRWNPMKWPCGVLEVEIRKKQGTLSRETKDTLQYFQQPEALKILENTPVDCLVIPWAAGLPQDGEHQENLKSLLGKGRQSGLCFVGLLEEVENQEKAINSAADAGLSAIMTPNPGKLESKLPIFKLYKRSTLSVPTKSPLLICEDALWPRLRSNSVADTDTIVAGPTGVPWIDSNGWYIQLARTLCQEKPIWLMFDPPKTTSSLNEESYVLALTDTEAHGARWIISIDDSLRSDLASGKPSALRQWKNITNTLQFFRDHQEWSSYKPKSVLAVVSDFSGSNEFLSGEVLNLLARRQVGFDVVEIARCTEVSLDRIKATLWLDHEPASQDVKGVLLSFVEKGGLLIVPKTWRKVSGVPKGTELDGRFEIYGIGKGILAVATEETEDPYQVAEETHLLLSRRNDLFRLYNAGAFNGYLTVSPDQKRSLLQLINYGGRNSQDPLSVWVKGSYPHAQVWRQCSSSASVLDGVPAQGGQEYYLPPIGHYAAIELENTLRG